MKMYIKIQYKIKLVRFNVFYLCRQYTIKQRTVAVASNSRYKLVFVVALSTYRHHVTLALNRAVLTVLRTCWTQYSVLTTKLVVN